jgi:acyl-coenzyme A synthetase/AMP-(fatty) acid ligase
MTALPLLAHTDMHRPMAYRQGKAISVAQYLADLQVMVQQLPDKPHVLLACADRYHFSLGLGAALVRGQTCLLPSTHTPEAIKLLQHQFPQAYCLTDEDDCTIALPQIRYAPRNQAAIHDALEIPTIDIQHVAAYVFTSGSTGTPVSNAKPWGLLVANVQAEAERLNITPQSGYVIVGTVPPQHMYGFESTVLIAMQNGVAFEAGKPFYPADITHTLAHLPRPRMLVTTPFHLRTLLAEDGSPPEVDTVLCATAPLSPQLAIEAEQCFKAPLIEIYGCTESGQLATRRTTHTQTWEMFRDVKVSGQHDKCTVSGGHVLGTVPMSDILEVLTPETFVLHGRSADMVNIAGKRTSIAYLNHHLNSITGVVDGAFLLPDEPAIADITRLAAFVVAPGLTEAQLMQALRQRIDAIFLPRPLRMVDALPRNTTGKLPREALLQLLQLLQ